MEVVHSAETSVSHPGRHLLFTDAVLRTSNPASANSTSHQALLHELVQKLTVAKPVKMVPALYGTVLTKARHGSSLSETINSAHPQQSLRQIRNNIITSPMPTFSGAQFVQVFQPKICTHFSHHVCYTSRQYHPLSLENYLTKLLIYQFSPSPSNFLTLKSNYPLSTLLSA